MAKLSKTQTVKNSVNSKFKLPIDKAVNKLKDFHSTFTTKIYSEDVKKWMAEAPTGGLDTHNAVTLYALDKSKKEIRVGVHRVKPFLVLSCDRYSSIKYVMTSKENTKHKILAKKLGILTDQQEDFRRIVRSALESCTTTKQVFERYPDIHKHIPVNETSSGQLIVPSLDVANAFKEPVPKSDKE